MRFPKRHLSTNVYGILVSPTKNTTEGKTMAAETKTPPKAPNAKPEVANNQPEVKKEEGITAEQKAKFFEELPSEFKEAITKVNSDIQTHNLKIDAIKASEAQDPKLIKAELFEQNPSNNQKIARLYAEYLKLIESAEKLKDQAYSIMDTEGLMPKDLSEAEINNLKTQVTDSTKDLRESVNALLKFEEMMPMFKDKISIHIAEIKTRRGAAKTGSATKASGEGPKRIRFKRIEVNGVTQDDKGNTIAQTVNGEEKYTFTFTAQYLKKQSKSINWTAKDLTDAYLKGLDENNLPDEHEFVMTHTFKDNNSNEQTVNYKIKAYR